MRSNTWVAAALTIVACGGSSPSTAETGEGAVTGTTRSAPTAAPDPASISCGGLLPAPMAGVSVLACSGVTAAPGGSTGTAAVAATGDATGSLALGCRNAQTGKDIFFVFLPFSGGYRQIAPLSEQAIPLQSGFYSTGQTQPAPGYFFDRSGRMLAAITAGGRAFASSAGTVELVTAPVEGISAQQYDGQGVPRGPPVRVGDVGRGPIALGGAANAAGHTLVIWGAAGERAIHARWLHPDGQPETPAFTLSGTSGQVGAASALPDGSVVVGGVQGPRWRSVVAPAATSESPVPEWLASRGAFTVVRGGKALLFGQELVAADGTSCGSLGLSSDPVGVALDGTVVTVASEKTFRVYPQLLR